MEDDALPPEDRARVAAPPFDLSALYRSEQPRLARYFSRRVRAEEVRDLVQDAFRSLLASGAAAGRRIACPEAYLTRIAGNLVRRHVRSESRKGSGRHQSFEEAKFGGDDPTRVLEARDALARLETAVARLKPKTREIFLLNRVDGLSYGEIAESLGMSVKGVEYQMAKALFELRRRVGPL